MLTHEQLMKLKLVTFAEGELVSVDTEENTGEMVYADGSVHPEYNNLLRASALLYQTLHYQKVALEQLVEASKAVGADGIIPTLDEMRGPVEFALMLTETGIEDYLEEKKI